MTPKEKAIEIVKKMYEHTGWLAETKEGFDKQDVLCAIICVDEIIEVLEKNRGFTQCVIDARYWQEVKTEINLL